MYMGKPKETKNENMKVRYCTLCDRYLKEGVYRYNDIYCPDFSKNIGSTVTCLEEANRMNLVLAEGYMKIAEKNKLEMEENWRNFSDEDKFQLENDLGLTLEEIIQMTVKELLQVFSKNKKYFKNFKKLENYRLIITDMYEDSLGLIACSEAHSALAHQGFRDEKIHP